ncbi:MAG TPA: septum formation initiator family protein [Gemmatimonadales bacterium]
MPPRRINPKLLVWLTVIGGALIYAAQGGEYNTLDFFRQRAQRVELEARVDSVRREVDSLRAHRRAIATDEWVQERIAREEFGMIRPGELLYRYVEPSRAPRAEEPARRP